MVDINVQCFSTGEETYNGLYCCVTSVTMTTSMYMVKYLYCLFLVLPSFSDYLTTRGMPVVGQVI